MDKLLHHYDKILETDPVNMVCPKSALPVELMLIRS
jgi:hypothetical protein